VLYAECWLHMRGSSSSRSSSGMSLSMLLLLATSLCSGGTAAAAGVRVRMAEEMKCVQVLCRQRNTSGSCACIMLSDVLTTPSEGGAE
jgi:hypothetical protein